MGGGGCRPLGHPGGPLELAWRVQAGLLLSPTPPHAHLWRHAAGGEGRRHPLSRRDPASQALKTCTQGDWDASKQGALPTSFLPGMVRFGKGLLCAGLWMTLGRRYNAGLLESPWWQSISVPRRLALVWVVGLAARLKYYFVWAVAEAGLVLSGQCFSGRDQKGHPRWQRYINTRVRSVEFQESLAALPASWNICTGKFLRHCELLNFFGGMCVCVCVGGWMGGWVGRGVGGRVGGYCFWGRRERQWKGSVV